MTACPSASNCNRALQLPASSGYSSASGLNQHTTEQLNKQENYENPNRTARQGIPETRQRRAPYALLSRPRGREARVVQPLQRQASQRRAQGSAPPAPRESGSLWQQNPPAPGDRCRRNAHRTRRCNHCSA